MKLSIAVVFGLIFGSASWAGPRDEPHLRVVPRTPQEAAHVAALTAVPATFHAPQQFEHLSAGAATVPVMADANAFSLPSDNIGSDKGLDFNVGKALFRKLWVSAPSLTLASDGLGPLFNARSCLQCHLKDGRGHPPEGPRDDGISMTLRVSVPAGAEDEIAGIEGYLATRPDPVYGTQLQDFSLPGIAAEHRLGITYEEVDVALSGGEWAQLRVPSYETADLGYGPLHADAMLSPRVAPQMIGLGLLEAVAAADILALADPRDADGDGISGRPNVVWSTEFAQPMLGRFGLKAGTPTIRQQSGEAFAMDMGISSPLNPAPWGECTASQQACRMAPHGDLDSHRFEIDAQGLDFVTFYSRNLAVPERRDVSAPEVLRGKDVFYQTGCVACHQPAFVTHRLEDRPEQSFQLIWHYTDILLHDMGPGLADHRPEARATGMEWRTAPLWGIGLTKQVSGHSYFLHDGRARNLLEAILWHGGEAQAQRDSVVEMPAADRAALLRFLESL